MVWQPGQSGNPGGGRPSGARNLVSNAFMRSVARKWAEHGDAVIERVIKEDPAKFLQIVASLVPKDVNLGDGGNLTIKIIQHSDPYDAAEQLIMGTETPGKTYELADQSDHGDD